MLIRNALGLISDSRRASISPVVSGPSAVHNATVSHSGSMRSISASGKIRSTPGSGSRSERLAARMRQPNGAARRAAMYPARAPGGTLAKLGRNLEQPVSPREHHHDNVFGNRALVAERVAYHDAGRQYCELDQLDPGRDRLHQPQPRRRRVVGAPVIADQDFGIGRGLPQRARSIGSSRISTSRPAGSRSLMPVAVPT